MKSKASGYFKYFGIFLLLSVCGGAVISLINRYLRLHYLTSSTTQWILCGLLAIYIFYLCRWLFHRLNAIEKQ